jgi:hypothetical protein
MMKPTSSYSDFQVSDIAVRGERKDGEKAEKKLKYSN